MPDRIVYSTDPARQPCPRCRAFPCECPVEAATLPPGEQRLAVRVEKKGRGGKTVTLVEGFLGPAAELQALARELRKKAGAGGAVKGGRIEIQGDKRELVAAELAARGYRVH